jgi:hypothetical protein
MIFRVGHAEAEFFTDDGLRAILQTKPTQSQGTRGRRSPNGSRRCVEDRQANDFFADDFEVTVVNT